MVLAYFLLLACPHIAGHSNNIWKRHSRHEHIEAQQDGRGSVSTLGSSLGEEEPALPPSGAGHSSSCPSGAGYSSCSSRRQGQLPDTGVFSILIVILELLVF